MEPFLARFWAEAEEAHADEAWRALPARVLAHLAAGPCRQLTSNDMAFLLERLRGTARQVRTPRASSYFDPDYDLPDEGDDLARGPASPRDCILASQIAADLEIHLRVAPGFVLQHVVVMGLLEDLREDVRRAAVEAIWTCAEHPLSHILRIALLGPLRAAFRRETSPEVKAVIAHVGKLLAVVSA